MLLNSKGTVRESGNIRKCFDEFYEDFVISDELRKVRTILMLIHHVLVYCICSRLCFINTVKSTQFN